MQYTRLGSSGLEVRRLALPRVASGGPALGFGADRGIGQIPAPGPCGRRVFGRGMHESAHA